MKLPPLPLLAVGVLTWAGIPALAQELPRPLDRGPEVPREEIPVKPTPVQPAPEILPPVVGPSCEGHCPSLNALWVEQRVPVQVLVPRLDVHMVRRPALVVDYRPEKREVIDVVMKAREVLRQVPCTTMVPCTETDPHTGTCSTVMKPVVDMKVEKDVEYFAVPVKRIEVVKVPVLRWKDELVPRKTIVLEYQTEFQRRGSALLVPGPAVPQTQWLTAPAACLPGDGMPLPLSAEQPVEPRPTARPPELLPVPPER